MARPEGRGDGVAALLPALAAAAALIALRPAHFYHWDEIQLRLGLDGVDLLWHQPHAPGYYGFVVLARALRWLLPDGFEAGRALSIAAAAAFVWLVGRRIDVPWPIPRRLLQLAPALLVVVCPLIAFFAVAHLTYLPEGALWVGILLAAGTRPRGPARIALAFCVGLAAAVRPTLLPFSLLLLAGPWLRTGSPTPREGIAAAFAAIAGVLLWWLPLVIETGGLAIYREASEVLGLGNVWAKSVFVRGPGVLVERLPAMLRDVLSAAGWALVLSGLALARRHRGRLPAQALADAEPLLAGAAIAFAFYALVIYDSAGYAICVVLPLAAHGLLSAGALVGSLRSPARGLAVAIATCAAIPAWTWTLHAPETSLAEYALHDTRVAARVDALRGRFDPETTLLLTSEEYWRWGLRHVMWELPEYTVLQLARDRFFVRATDDAPYLVARRRRIGSEGPDGLEASQLRAFAGGAGLRDVVYVVPFDDAPRLGPACRRGARTVPTAAGERLLALPAAPPHRLFLEEGRLRCRDAP